MRHSSTARSWWAPTRPASTCSVEFPGDRYLHVHLGLIGKFDLRPAPVEPPLVGPACDCRTRRRTPTCAVRPSAT